MLSRTIRHLQNLSLRILFLGTTPGCQLLGHGPRKNQGRDTPRNGPLARELYAQTLPMERWAMREIMALPELESINLADARSRKVSDE